MSSKDALEKGLDAIKDAAKNVKDAITEAGHRSAAEGEQMKRDVAGDEMTVSEKAGSMANQAKESVLADVDRAKRAVRENT
jgi:hypothetical protein